jgi:hypothetical protein
MLIVEMKFHEDVVININLISARLRQPIVNRARPTKINSLQSFIYHAWTLVKVSCFLPKKGDS